MTPVVIRDANTGDAELILKFIHELAQYEKAEHEVSASIVNIRDSIFGPDSNVKALICTLNGEAIGFAVYFYNYSTWQGQNGLYLEDLYVSPKHRGAGAGKALLKHLAKKAIAENCGRFEWNVLDWNTPAIDFYQSIGATAKSEWLGYRLAGDALLRFAAD